MAEQRRERRQEGVADILSSQVTPLNKVRKLVALGYDESLADDLVVNAEVGPSQSMFYERLPQPDYDSSKEPAKAELPD